MERKLIIEIECGEKTCASEPGKFCNLIGSRHFGGISICTCFSRPDSKGILSFVELEEKDGWLLRCDECLAAEKE
jgi:hypothetical protein